MNNDDAFFMLVMFNVFIWFLFARAKLFVYHQRKYLAEIKERTEAATAMKSLDRIEAELDNHPKFYRSVFDLRKWTYKQFFSTNLL